MTLDEVAAYTQLPKFTLYKMRSEGRGPRAARIGKHLRYRRTDVDAWIRSKMDDWTDRGWRPLTITIGEHRRSMLDGARAGRRDRGRNRVSRDYSGS